MESGHTARQGRSLAAQQQELQSRAKWTDGLSMLLVDLMVDQVQKGNRPKKSFGKKAWKHICNEFQKKTGFNWGKEQLKNRYTVLRGQYITLKCLLDDSNFSWDDSTGAIIAMNEAWDHYIMEHPDAEALRATGCPIYKQLCMIFSEPTINGGQPNGTTEHEDGNNPFAYLCSDPLSIQPMNSSSDLDEEAGMADEQEQTQSPALNPAGFRKRGRKGIDDAIVSAILEMAAGSKLRAAAIEQCNARYSIANCVRALDEMQGMDERTYFGALNLFDKPSARETFLSLNANKRLHWLGMKCSAPSCSG